MGRIETWSQRMSTILLLAGGITASCSVGTGDSAPGSAPPAAPNESNRRLANEEKAGRTRHTEADVRFMHGMISHHAQALEMARLVPTRTDRAAIRLFAQRIELSQEDEIALMLRWLRDRHEEIPTLPARRRDNRAGDHQARMPGMLAEEQLAQLAEAAGAEFVRLFLEFMIYHHDGALIMVAELFSSGGAAQETEIFEFASHVYSDQRIEIERMRHMLDAGP